MENLDKDGDGVLCPMAVVIRDEKILLGLRHYTPDKWKKISVWTIPGGRSEKGETIGTTLLREVEEEIGVTDLKIESYLGEVAGMKDPDVVLLFKCITAQEPKLMEPEKFGEWKWFGKDEIPENFVNPIALETIKKELS
jgi:8-oxo-dGTP diphosphatase